MFSSAISFIIALAIVILVVKFIFKSATSIIGFLINAAVGAVALWILDIVGFGVPINWITAAVVGFLGIPGVILLVVLKHVFHLF